MIRSNNRRKVSHTSDRGSRVAEANLRPGAEDPAPRTTPQRLLVLVAGEDCAQAWLQRRADEARAQDAAIVDRHGQIGAIVQLCVLQARRFDNHLPTIDLLAEDKDATAVAVVRSAACVFGPPAEFA